MPIADLQVPGWIEGGLLDCWTDHQTDYNVAMPPIGVNQSK
jgi:hypothetical protein